MTIPVSIRRSLVATLATFLLLAGCSQDTQPDTGNPPADAPTALVYGMANSPVYEALKSRVRMTQWDGSQKAADFDLVILDGDGYGAQQLREDELVRQAVRGGLWVLGLDLEEDHKQVGFAYLLEASTAGRSSVYLTRKTLDAAYHPTTRVIEFADNQAGSAQSVAQDVVRYLKEPELGVQQGSDVPQNLLHVTYYFTNVQKIPMPTIHTVSDPQGQPQTATLTTNRAVKVFLENDSVPQGDFQWVMVETEGIASPGPLSVNKQDEIAWYQTQFSTSSTFSNRDGIQPPTLVEARPLTTNGTESVTTDVNFSIGFSKDGPSGSFGYSNSTTKEISDWAVSNTSDNTTNVPMHTYYSQNPVNGLITDDGVGRSVDASAFSGFPTYLPVQPNALSKETLDFFVQALFKTNQVIDDELILDGEDTVWYTDAWCEGFHPQDQDDCDVSLLQDFTRISRYLFGEGKGSTVNLGAVVPIPIKSLTFSPNPVVAGQNTTGTLTLEKAAETDIYITLSSQSEFATPTQNVYTILKGEDHVDFTIETSQDGTGKDFGAVIRAFYAEGQNAELQITQPSSSD